MLAAGGYDGVVRLFLLDDPTLETAAVDMRSDTINTTDGDTSIEEYSTPRRGSSSIVQNADVPTVTPIFLPVAVHKGCVTQIVFSPDGKYILTLYENNHEGAH
uniref:Autophagy-related protein 21 n=1 Tax=Lygus hesperus TaxID=30085 RepID=A0A0A9YXZ2_LYGHE